MISTIIGEKKDHVVIAVDGNLKTNPCMTVTINF